MSFLRRSSSFCSRITSLIRKDSVLELEAILLGYDIAVLEPEDILFQVKDVVPALEVDVLVMRVMSFRLKDGVFHVDEDVLAKDGTGPRDAAPQ